MSDAPKLRIILHGKSADHPPLREAVEDLRAGGAGIDVRVTWEAGDAGKLAGEAMRDAAEGAFDTLVAAGGDGTLNEVVAAALDADPEPSCAFGLLPMGTANDFAHGLGLPVDDLTAALRLCAAGEAKETDVGVVNGRPFVNMLTGGQGAKLTAETDPGLKRALGGAAYIFTGIGRFSELTALEGGFEADDGRWSGRFIAMAVGNGRQAGGGVQLCPLAEVDDGLLDVTILPALEGEALAAGFEALLEKGLEALDEWPVRMRTRRLVVEGPEALAVNLDGEPLKADRLEIGVRPAAIRFRRP